MSTSPYEPPKNSAGDGGLSLRYRRALFTFLVTAAVVEVCNLVMIGALRADRVGDAWAENGLLYLNLPAFPVLLIVVAIFPPAMGEEYRMLSYEVPLLLLYGTAGAIFYGLVAGFIAWLGQSLLGRNHETLPHPPTTGDGASP